TRGSRRPSRQGRLPGSSFHQGGVMARFIRLSVAVALLAGGALYAARAGPAGGAREKGKVKLTADEEKVLELTNEQRKRKKLPPLKLNPLLVKVARQHSANM